MEPLADKFSAKPFLSNDEKESYGDHPERWKASTSAGWST